MWITLSLIRGATDGWVPYPLKDPADGHAPVAMVDDGIVVGVAIGATLLRLTRWRMVVPAWLSFRNGSGRGDALATAHQLGSPPPLPPRAWPPPYS